MDAMQTAAKITNNSNLRGCLYKKISGLSIQNKRNRIFSEIKL